MANSNVSNLSFIPWFVFLMPAEGLFVYWGIISASGVPGKKEDVPKRHVSLTLASRLLKQGTPHPIPGSGTGISPRNILLGEGKY